jgi:hypothetical protein
VCRLNIFDSIEFADFKNDLVPRSALAKEASDFEAN